MLLRWDSIDTIAAFRQINTFNALFGTKIPLQHKLQIGLETVEKIAIMYDSSIRAKEL